MAHRNGKPKPHASKRTLARWHDRQAGVEKVTKADYSKTNISTEGFSKPKSVSLG